MCLVVEDNESLTLFLIYFFNNLIYFENKFTGDQVFISPPFTGMIIHFNSL